MLDRGGPIMLSIIFNPIYGHFIEAAVPDPQTNRTENRQGRTIEGRDRRTVGLIVLGVARDRGNPRPCENEREGTLGLSNDGIRRSYWITAERSNAKPN